MSSDDEQVPQNIPILLSEHFQNLISDDVEEITTQLFALDVEDDVDSQEGSSSRQKEHEPEPLSYNEGAPAEFANYLQSQSDQNPDQRSLSSCVRVRVRVLSEEMKLAWLRSLETAHQDCVWACTWVPATDKSPGLLLTGSLDETVKLWNPEDLSLVRTNTGHCLGVVSVAAHPSGKIAASASMDSFIRVFDVESNNTIATLEAPPSEVWQMQFNPRVKFLHLVYLFNQISSASIKLWDTAEWKLISTLSIPRPEGSKPSDKGSNKKFVLFCCHGAQVEDSWHVGSMDCSISDVLMYNGQKFLHHLEATQCLFRSLAYSPLDPRVLVSGSDDECIHMYDAEGKTLFSSMSGHSSWVLSVECEAQMVQQLHQGPVTEP
ncbi:hypothetical protein E3N88_43331 [Mikania micrantha]|uniref:Uncharacterized protein n=1 Tax=Mikania micrantha TaxID=192012 RepID=A0A5N6LFD2_9ASTR|nr:hypothetical protein E3N88_43331 [Mikania micrantha]